MHMPFKTIGFNLLSVLCCMVLSTVVFSEDKIYDKPDVQQPGRTIHGKVITVAKGDAATHQWDVSVQNGETGELVPLCVDKTTARKQTDVEPAVGDEVVVKYDEQSKHALSFVADTALSK
jgi:hypothetical protein